MRRRQEDLHGYGVLTAIDFALDRVREAYENGYDEIELVHGSAAVQAPVEDGRGRIKWELRTLYEQGGFDAWCWRDRSWPRAGSLLLALKRHARPRTESWAPEPRRAHRR